MKTFRPYEPDQIYLLPPSLSDWLPEHHLARFVSDTVDQMDLSAITNSYEEGDGRGQPPYHPLMMVKLLLYAYCKGRPSSRKIEQATVEDVAYRFLSAGSNPDHASISEFRARHRIALSNLFLNVLELCQEAGLVKLGHVALDGSKIKANASKHKAMSYERMKKTEKELKEEIERLLQQAEAADREEDEKYGKGVRGDELPQELQRRESRLKKIQEAKAALEAQARERAEEKARETGTLINPAAVLPAPKAQRNFTDPQSRIMMSGSTKSFDQCYNTQIAVDGQAQIIVAADVVQDTNDKKQLVPMLLQVEENLGGLPDATSADAGYFSEDNVLAKELAATNLHIPPHRQKHGEKPLSVHGRARKNISVADQMRRKLQTKKGRAIYRFRKSIVEPVFGQIKEVRHFRQFLFRGLTNVKAEWNLICLTHNLLKLYRYHWLAHTP